MTRRGLKTLFYIGFFFVSAIFLIESVFALNVFGTSKFFYRLYLLSAIATLSIAFIMAYVTRVHPWFLIVIFGVIFVTLGISAIDLYKEPKKIPSKELDTLTLDAFSTTPLVSTVFRGRKTEPMSFVIAGKESDLKDIFNKEGWSEAEQITLKNSYRTIWDSVTKQDYPSAPVSPQFWERMPHNFAFSKTVGDSVRQRHHMRFWKTPYTYQGKNVFIATASYDENIAIGLYVHIPTHKINPNVDEERRFVFNSMLKSGEFISSNLLEGYGKYEGRNAFGHKFTTDGQIYFIELK